MSIQYKSYFLGKYGFYAPNIGGFSLIDLKTGKIVKTFTSRIAEGIFSVKTLFTNDNKYAVSVIVYRFDLLIFIYFVIVICMYDTPA